MNFTTATGLFRIITSFNISEWEKVNILLLEQWDHNHYFIQKENIALSLWQYDSIDKLIDRLSKNKDYIIEMYNKIAPYDDYILQAN